MSISSHAALQLILTGRSVGITCGEAKERSGTHAKSKSAFVIGCTLEEYYTLITVYSQVIL